MPCAGAKLNEWQVITFGNNNVLMALIYLVPHKNIVFAGIICLVVVSLGPVSCSLSRFIKQVISPFNKLFALLF